MESYGVEVLGKQLLLLLLARNRPEHMQNSENAVEW